MSVPTVALESPSGPGGSDMYSMDEQHQGLLGTQLKEMLEPHKMKTLVHEEYILFSSVSVFAVYNRCTVHYHLLRTCLH